MSISIACIVVKRCELTTLARGIGIIYPALGLCLNVEAVGLRLVEFRRVKFCRTVPEIVCSNYLLIILGEI